MEFGKQLGVRLRTAWLQLDVAVLDLLLAVTALFGSLSLFAIASGEPETVAMVALAGLAVIALGIAFVRLSEHCRTDGLSLP